MKLFNFFSINRNQNTALKPIDLMNKITFQSNDVIQPFTILLLGGFNDSSSNQTIDLTLKSISINPSKKDFYYLAKNDKGIFFNVYLFKNANQLIYNSLMVQSNLILLIYEDLEDFNRCIDLLSRFKQSIPSATKIYYLNKPTGNSEQDYIIAKKAVVLGYNKLEENEIKLLLENAQDTYLKTVKERSVFI